VTSNQPERMMCHIHKADSSWQLRCKRVKLCISSKKRPSQLHEFVWDAVSSSTAWGL